MAEQITHDVVKEAQSMGEASPIDDSAATTNPTSAGDGQAQPSLSGTAAPAEPDLIQSVKVEGANEAEDVRAPTPVIVGDGIDGVLQLPTEDANSIAVVDLSGGSDTDSSRPDGVDSSKDNYGHVRSNSIKKPATFKSVSVTKSFLAKAATSSPAPKGVDSRGSSPASGAASTPQSARPRLVAKSGSSGLTPRSGLASASGAAGGPDASKVWNKNRPVAPPPTKQLTDEELKQQYGIHMATRLQADESGKESKWADIDDDEDDWVPESVEWMDGTKSSVVTGEQQADPILQREAQLPEHALERRVEAAAPVTAIQRPSSTAGTKTILKPGVNMQSPANQQRATNGLVLKGAPEKPTLVVKSPAPTPVKSPWATLPPVDRVPPVAPPVQPPPQARFIQQDPHGFESLPPMAAAKEIAADDFNRAWHDEQPQRALYDSKSGRYEPVNETRRNSTRDHGYRQPAVLQRPMAQDSRGGPAEPSAAFQTTRSGVEGSWERRRTSSSLSGGSGNFARRMSMSRSGDIPASLELHSQRRDSSSFGGSAVSPADQFRAGVPQDARSYASPMTSRWSRASPSMQHAQPNIHPAQHDSNDNEQMSPPDGGHEPEEDPVARQQRMMREKIQRAREAKLREQQREEEEKEARKERLRLKMQDLAAPSPTTDSVEPSVDNKPDEQAGASKSHVQPGSELPPHARSQIRQQLSPSKSSPPKPQIPSTDGETTQFGLIKLHPTQSTRKPTTDPTLLGRTSAPQPQAGFVRQDGVRGQTRNVQPPQDPSVKPDATASDGNEALLNWGQNQGPQGNAAGNIWGAGIGTLGNGVFTTQQAKQMQTADAPERPERFGGRRAPFAGGRYDPTAAGTEPPSATGVDAWARLTKELPERERAEAEQARQKLSKLEQGGYQTGARVQVTHRKTDPNTGKVIGESSNSARSENLVYAGQGINGMPNGATPIGSSSGAITGPNNFIAPFAQGSSAAQSSLNRAVGAERAHAQAPQVGTSKPSSKFAQFFEHRSGSNSPPPPDALNNELMDGNPRSPGVRLPAPKPQVKLPSTLTNSNGPALHSAPQPPASASRAVPVLTSRPQMPLAENPDWKSKFASLFVDHQAANTAGARHGPTAAPVQPVASASKATLDVIGPAARNLATVSLPASRSSPVRVVSYRFALDTSDSVTSKTTAEEDLLEDRQFGSLPVVRVPKDQYINQRFNDFAKVNSSRHQNRINPRPVLSFSLDTPSPVLNEAHGNGKGTVVRVLLPGMRAEKNKMVPRKHGEGRRQFSGSGRRGGRGNHGHHHSSRGGAAHT